MVSFDIVQCFTSWSCTLLGLRRETQRCGLQFLWNQWFNQVYWNYPVEEKHSIASCSDQLLAAYFSPCFSHHQSTSSLPLNLSLSDICWLYWDFGICFWYELGLELVFLLHQPMSTSLFKNHYFQYLLVLGFNSFLVDQPSQKHSMIPSIKSCHFLFLSSISIWNRFTTCILWSV